MRQSVQAVSYRKHRITGRLKTLLLGLLIFLLFLLLLLEPVAGINGAKNGLLLCGEVIIPSLFPFLVLSVFFIDTGLAQRLGRVLEKPVRFLFRLPGSAAAALALGIIGGYPVGAKACADLHRRGALSKNEADRLLLFCINSSPAFIIGAVGSGLLGSPQAGLLLYAAHITASLVLGVVSSLFARRKPQRVKRAPATGDSVPAALVGAVTSSASSIVNICAFVILFSALSSLLTDTGAAEYLAAAAGFSNYTGAFRGAVRGILEVSNGCAAASQLGGMAGIFAISAFLSWSGLSVISQVLYAVKGEGLSIRWYLLSRLPHMLLSMAVTWLLFRILPIPVPAFVQGITTVSPGFHSAPGSAALLIVCSLLILSQVTL